MEGGEKEFLVTIAKAAHDAIEAYNDFTYVEIGLAHGETFKGVWELIKRISSTQSKAIGLELESWEGVAALEKDFKCETIERHAEMPLVYGSVVILGRSQETLTSLEWRYKIHAAFIDGCHGKPCVIGDFLALEPHVQPGGIVIFHDAGENEQGGDIQPHCQQPIGVREAINELGLFEREGWEFVKMIPTQNQCAVFRKI